MAKLIAFEVGIVYSLQEAEVVPVADSCPCAGRYTGQPDTFVELKTSLALRGPHDEPRFEKCVENSTDPGMHRSFCGETENYSSSISSLSYWVYPSVTRGFVQPFILLNRVLWIGNCGGVSDSRRATDHDPVVQDY